MKPIMKLVTSGNKEDVELAKELLTDDEFLDIKEHLVTILVYLGPLSHDRTPEDFRLVSVNSWDTFDRIMRCTMSREEYDKKYWNRQVIITEEQARKSLKILME